MKRYEKMSNEDIVNLLLNPKEQCAKCPVPESECFSLDESECVVNIVRVLKENVEIKPRIATVNTVDELIAMSQEHKANCDEHCKHHMCSDCKYHVNEEEKFSGCFCKYLAEEIEVNS